MISPVASVRAQIASAVRARVAGPDASAVAEKIWGAPGERRFAEDSPICRVQGNATMYTGGIRALLLQSLHPLAMAGVGEHSGYRSDPWGRLQRTSRFIAMTTFGPIASAEKAIDRINKVHASVKGHARDGRPYSALDPHLLRWVHVAEVDSFLTAYQRLSATPLTRTEADEYVAQTAYVATRLGVIDAPTSVTELRRGVTSFRNELEATPGALDVARFIVKEPPLPGLTRPAFFLFAAGAVSMLPNYAREMLDLHAWRGWQEMDDFLIESVGGRLGKVATGAVAWAAGSPGGVRSARH